MYTLAIGLAANVVALHADASIDIVGDAAAARSLAAAGAATGAAAEGSLAQDGAPAEVSIVAHPLSQLKLSLCAGAATLTFQWMPTLEVLTASAEPRSLEATLRSLDEMQLENDGSGAGEGGRGGRQRGRSFPDLPSLLRARGGCKRQPLVVEALQLRTGRWWSSGSEDWGRYSQPDRSQRSQCWKRLCNRSWRPPLTPPPPPPRRRARSR